MISIKSPCECCGCGACISTCPMKCIEMKPNHEGFLYPTIDADKCINCGKCERVCPYQTNKKIERKPIATYCAYAADEDTRISSSSGGVFSVCARNVLQRGGIVFGAAFSSDYRYVKHIGIVKEEELSLLKSSKYLQSEIGTSFTEAEKCLIENRPVLFSGTPCQIEGLKNYLGKDYPSLVCVEVVCHGVPSQRIWDKYLSFLETKNRSKITEVNFRHKRIGWHRFSLQTKHTNRRIIYSAVSVDPYMRSFIDNYNLRESCYNCHAKENCCADITLGDFWRAERFDNMYSDEKGLSLVIANTEKGDTFLKSISNELRIHPDDYQTAITGNPVLLNSVKRPECRSDFYQDLERLQITDLFRKYNKLSSFTILKRKIADTYAWLKIRKHIRGVSTNLRYGICFVFDIKGNSRQQS